MSATVYSELIYTVAKSSAISWISVVSLSGNGPPKQREMYLYREGKQISATQIYLKKTKNLGVSCPQLCCILYLYYIKINITFYLYNIKGYKFKLVAQTLFCSPLVYIPLWFGDFRTAYTIFTHFIYFSPESSCSQATCRHFPISPIPYAIISGCQDLRVINIIMNVKSAQCLTVSWVNFASKT